MGNTTSLNQLIAKPSSHKVYLTEIQLAENLNDKSFILHSGNCYKITGYYIDIILLASGLSDKVYKTITTIKEDGTALTAKTNVSDVINNAGSFWHDITNQILYIRCSDDANPITHEIIGFFWMYFATEGKVFNNNYYEPYIATSGIPTTVQKNQSIFWGTSRPASGSLTFLNHNGFFDMITAKYIWDNKQVKIMLGGDSLPYSEYTTIFMGRIRERKFTRAEFTCLIISPTFDLLRSIPVNNFWKSSFPNLDPSAEGKPIPVYYGVFSAAQAPIVTCINTAYAANTYQFQIADGAIKSITQVYVDYGDGVGWQTIAHGNEDLTNARFTIVAASFVVGISKVKVAFEGRHTGGSRIERGPYIVEDILTGLCGYASTDLNTASFTASKIQSEYDLNVGIEKVQSALTYIAEICKSDFAFFDEDNNGLLRYRTWEPGAAGAATSINETDILISETPEINTRWEDLFYKIYVGYGYSYNISNYLYLQKTDDLSRRKYEKDDYYRHETYIRSSGDANILAQRLLFICKNPLPILSLRLKFPLPTLLQGDMLRVTMTRAPASTGGGFISKLFEIQGLEKRYSPGGMTVQAYDSASYGKDVGRWMSSAAPNWAVATIEEKEESGFWLDSSGYASTDRSSKNVSLWW